MNERSSNLKLCHGFQNRATESQVAVVEDLVRFGISMNQHLLTKFDESIERRGYTNRSEAIRDLVRTYLVEEEWQTEDVLVAGTVTLVYDHHSPVNRALSDLQHDSHAVIVSTLHVHQDAHHCLEVIVLRGPARQVKELANRMISLKGIKVGRLAIASTGKEIP